MNYSLLILLCFLPMIILFIGIKFLLLFTETSKEIKHVHSEAQKPHGPYLENVYADVDAEEEEC